MRFTSTAAFISLLRSPSPRYKIDPLFEQNFHPEQQAKISRPLADRVDMTKMPESSALEDNQFEQEYNLDLRPEDITSLYSIISSCIYEDDDSSNLMNAPLLSTLHGATLSLVELINKAQKHILLSNEQSDTRMRFITTDEFLSITSQECPKMKLVKASLLAAESLRCLMREYGPSKGKGRKALMSTVEAIGGQTESHRLSTISIVASLSICAGEDASIDDHHSVSRACVSGLLPNGRYQHQKTVDMVIDSKVKTIEESSMTTVNNDFGGRVVCALLDIAASSDEHKIDVHIITSLARSFGSKNAAIEEACATVVRRSLHLSDNGSPKDTSRPETDKRMATAAFGLAAEVGPWKIMSCIPLIDMCHEMQLWHAAERLCASAIQCESNEVIGAVNLLIDGAFEQHMYRRADSLATEFYDHGGKSRFIEARFLHACDTISRVVKKRQFPIIERQVERFDRAIDRVQNDNASVDCEKQQVECVAESIDRVQRDNTSKEPFSKDDFGNLEEAKIKVREFALTRLREANVHDSAHRLSALWGMEWWYDSDDVEKYLHARRERYIQWEDAFPEEDGVNAKDVPDVVSAHDELLNVFKELESTINSEEPVMGFDVEWGDKSDGAALLQLSTATMSILIDVPGLTMTHDGCQSLESTVGRVFGSSTIKLLGFSCREDLRRLASSPSIQNTHWFSCTNAVVDIKPLIGIDTPKLRSLGLSRACEHYLGKPLDKSEQCSMWEQRPLSESQRAYAALDAWACVSIFGKISFRTFTSTSTKRKLQE